MYRFSRRLRFDRITVAIVVIDRRFDVNKSSGNYRLDVEVSCVIIELGERIKLTCEKCFISEKRVNVARYSDSVGYCSMLYI